jgi:hypothetical protein
MIRSAQMGKWDDLSLDLKITQILDDVHYANPEHHLGRPFLTAYQIAIELNQRHPLDVATIGFPIGGKGTDEHNSLAQYVAGQLSRRIGAGKLPRIEGGFLSNRHLSSVRFSFGKTEIESSSTGGSHDLSMFRLND